MARCTHVIIVIILLSSISNAQFNYAIDAFNTGEISPIMEAYSSFPKYNSSCRTLENMLVLAQGPVTRRPGTKYITDVNDSDDKARLIPFEYSKTDTYVLELTDKYMRFYRNGGQILSGVNPYEISMTYGHNDLFEIQYVQSANVMYMVHPNHPPQKLERAAHTSWTIADVNFVNGPFLDENITSTQITPSDVNGTITLVADANTWVSGHVGALWKIGHRRAATSINGVLDANESSSSISCSGDYDWNIQGTWVGTATLERSFDGSTWEAVKPRFNNNSAINEDYSDSEDEDGVIYQVTMTNFVSGSATYNFSVHDYMHYGYVKITTYTDANEVSATVYSELASTNATSKWSESSWSDYRGWPPTLEFHEQRLIFGGSESYPQTIWVSKTDDYENMSEGLDDDDAFIYVLPGQNPIQWMLSQNYLLIGTLGSVGRLGDETDPMTPTNPNYKTQAKHGSAYIQAVMAGDAILYIERGGRKVREFVYSLERDRFLSPDMTVLAEHITSTGIKEIAIQSRPDSILWCVLDDGNIATLTYKREQEVVAWSLQTTTGNAESITIIPGTDEDEVWIIAKRTIDGSDVRYVEQFQPRDWGTEQSDCFFVDSGLIFDGGDAVDITNITQADPTVVTVSLWPTDGDGDNLGDGDQILIIDVEGMTDINDVIYTISNPVVGSLTFELRDSTDIVDINSVGFESYDSGGTVQRYEKDFSNLGHLEGEEVVVFADGACLENVTISSSATEISEWSNKVIIGLGFTSKIETMPITFDTREGSITALKKRVSNIGIDFYKTLGAQYGIDEDNLSPVEFISDELLDEPVSLFTGFKENLPFKYGYRYKSTIYIEESNPVPLTIRGIYPRLDYTNE